MADLAYQHNISRDKRRYIGRWANESTADIYTRDHRTVICQIWTEVTSRISETEGATAPAAPGADKPKPASSSTDDLLRTVPEDLTAEYYRLSGDEEPAPDDWNLVALTPRTDDTPAKRPKTYASLHRIPADLAPPDVSGPYSVNYNLRADKNGQHKIHLLTVHGTAAGCGWQPKPSQTGSLLEPDWTRDPDTYSLCVFCFRRYTWPTTWSTLTTPDTPASESSDSDESATSTDSAIDSASETEALKVPPVNSLRPTSGSGLPTDD
jgi:hypothetical protein